MAVLFFATAPPGFAQISTVLKKVKVPRPDPEMLIDLLDALTKKPGDTKTQAKVRSLLPSQKLQVGKSHIDVSLSDSESNWRGSVQVELEIPTVARYTVDPKKLDVKALHWDVKKRVLRIKLPPVEVESVTAKLTDITVATRYSGARFGFKDSDIALTLERGLLRTDYEPAAKRQAELSLEVMQTQGRKELENMLQKLFKAANTEVAIKVE